MMVDPDSVAIVRAVLSLAEALDMKTTAEGIENRELAATLARSAATGQGFYCPPAGAGGSAAVLAEPAAVGGAARLGSAARRRASRSLIAAPSP